MYRGPQRLLQILKQVLTVFQSDVEAHNPMLTNAIALWPPGVMIVWCPFSNSQIRLANSSVVGVP
jgi:hypothetical protein